MRWVVWGLILTGVAVALAAAFGGCQGEPRSPDRPAGEGPRYIFIADWANNRVVRMDDMAGTGWTTLSAVGGRHLRFPVGVWADAGGRVYVAEQRHDHVLRADEFPGAKGAALAARDDGPKRVNKYAGSWVCTDDRGRVYVTYDGRHRVVRVDDMGGKGWTAFGEEGSGRGQFRYPAGVAVDARGRIYVADFDNFRLVRFDDMAGTNWTSYGEYGTGVGQFINPCGVGLDSQGHIYVADQGNDRVVRIDDMGGTNWTAVGTFGTEREPGKLYAPTGVCVDRLGRIYVTESSSNHRVVRMDDMTGANWTVLGTVGFGRGEFTSPMGISVR